MAKSRERRSLGIGLIVSVAILLVVGTILAAATSSVALLGAVVGGLPAVVMLSILLISISGSTRHVLISRWRFLAVQPVALAVAATGVATAVASHEKGHQFIGGALTAVAIAVDALISTFWWRDRRAPIA